MVIGLIATIIVARQTILDWKEFRKKKKIKFGVILIVVSLIFIPLGCYMISNPESTIKEDSIARLADSAMMNRNIWEWDIWDGGDAVSYGRLIEIAKDKHNLKLSEFVRKQIERVQQSYSDSDILVRRIRLDGKDKNGGWLYNEDNTTEYLIGFLHSKQNVLKTYSRAAQLLEDRKSKEVLDELIGVMKSNPSLLIRKIALDSFTKLATPLGFKQKENDLLNFNSAIVFWKFNRKNEEIIKKLVN